MLFMLYTNACKISYVNGQMAVQPVQSEKLMNLVSYDLRHWISAAIQINSKIMPSNA